MSIIEEKRRLRKEINMLKSVMQSGDKERECRNVIAQLESDADFKMASVVLAYWSLDDELDVRPLIKKWAGIKKFLLPKIIGKELELIEFKGEEQMVKEPRFGILEPIGKPFTDYGKIDLVIVPGIAFDKQGFRIGHGGGFYDRLLPRLYKAKKIGVGFSFQLVSKVPCEAHDELLDKLVISES